MANYGDQDYDPVTKLGSLTNAGRLLKSDGDGTASEGQIEDSVSGNVLDLVATLTAKRTLTLPDADLDLSQVTGGLAGADAKLLTGTAGTSGNVAMWNADDDVVDGSVAADEIVTAASTLTNNTIPKGDGSRGLADSAITDDGSTVSINNTKLTSTNIQVNDGGSGDRYAYIDLIGDDTYSSYGLRMIRNNTGPNTNSAIYHRGTGNLIISTDEAADIVFQTDSTNRLKILSSGGLELASGNVLTMDGNTVLDTNRLLNLRAYTVATLPSAGTLGRKAAASDGRKSGEGAGSGTGVEVMDDGSQWYCEDTSSAVAA